MQIVRWFQNHAYLDRKSCGDVKTKKNKVSPSPSNEEDGEAVKLHLDQLEKELRKKNRDDDKVSRLLSLTFTSRRTAMLKHSAVTRTDVVLQQFICLKRPIFVSTCTNTSLNFVTV